MKKLILSLFLINIIFIIAYCGDDEPSFPKLKTPVLVTDVASSVPYGGYATIVVQVDDPYIDLKLQVYNPENEIWADSYYQKMITQDGYVILMAPTAEVSAYSTSSTEYKYRICAYSISNTPSDWLETSTFGLQSPVEYLLASESTAIFGADELETDYFAGPQFSECLDCELDTSAENKSTITFGPSTLVTYNVQFTISDSSATPDFDGCVIEATIEGVGEYSYYNGVNYLTVSDILVPADGFSITGCNSGTKDITLDSTLREAANNSLKSVGEVKDMITFNFDKVAANSSITLAITEVPYKLISLVFDNVIPAIWDTETADPDVNIAVLVNKWHLKE